MNKNLTIASALGFLAVAIGAFGAHAIRDSISAAMYENFKTGNFYHFVHALAILVISFWNAERLNAAIIFFTVGIILFSFSLYLYAITSIKTFAMITPLGGVSFLIGWGILFYRSIKKAS